MQRHTEGLYVSNVWFQPLAFIVHVTGNLRPKKKRHLFLIAARISLKKPAFLFFSWSQKMQVILLTILQVVGSKSDHYLESYGQKYALLYFILDQNPVLHFCQSTKKNWKNSPTIRLLWHAPQYCKTCWICIHFYKVEFKRFFFPIHFASCPCSLWLTVIEIKSF